MKNSLKVVLPAALIVSVLGCSHSRDTSTRIQPRRASGLTAEDIARNPGVPVEALLASHVPGIRIGRASDGRTVMIVRGQNSLEPQEPLFVVNGVPLANAANFLAVNRNDIESIDVLKDGASAAMYGLRGSAGVIVIKTRGP
jgi:TonB-dependent SusC/RagA subfamily outer membrane receptor